MTDRDGRELKPGDQAAIRCTVARVSEDGRWVTLRVDDETGRCPTFVALGEGEAQAIGRWEPQVASSGLK